MKKKLVVLLAVVMMFAFSASAYAATFSDVSERSVVEQDAIKKAVALGIIEGYEDGTFGPDKTITRAEFAKIAVTAAGAKETATMLEANASAFKDVRANSWYTGWINAAESLGIFKGDLNGNFRPNDTISNQEAITVLLRLLGYNDNLTGSWPVNYVTKANQIGILDDVNIVASAAAKRGDVVVMLGETLDTPIVTYDKDTNEFVYKQTTKSGSSYITLLDDSFAGSFIEVTGVNRFEPINQVRNVAEKTLNWNVVGWQANLSSATNENKVSSNGTNFSGTLVVDENTAVSYNAEGLFDLQGHQGKVYYVTENDRKYARFIEVDSYVQTVTDKVEEPGNNKVKVLSTNYNATSDVQVETNASKGFKNTNIKLYFNDDDQVYWAVSDKYFEDKAYYVKAITTASARLVGTKTRTVNMADADTLVYIDGKFASPSDLEVGDAVMEIREGELYVKVNDASGDFTRTENTLSNGFYQHKATMGGKKYVFIETEDLNNNDKPANNDDDAVDSIVTLNPVFYEEDLEVSDVTSEDVYNNNVKFLLNKDNSVAAIIVDETSTGTTLYGIVVDGGGNGSWGKNMSNITLFTQEGYTVTYDFAKSGKPTDDEKTTDVDETAPEYWMGQPVSYKLDADGNIKSFSRWSNVLSDGDEIKVRNNAYLVNENSNKRLSISLASNVVIFEVGEDKHEVDVSLITRSSLLSGGDFTPESLTGNRQIQMGYNNDTNKPVYQDLHAYAKYEINSNNSVKALAYTVSSSTTYHYGVVNAWRFTDADHAGYKTGNASNDDFAVTLVGDDKIYDLDPNCQSMGGAGHFIVYTLSGDKLTVVKNYGKTDAANGLKDKAKLVTGFNDGWIYFDNKNGIEAYIDEFNKRTVTQAQLNELDSDDYIILDSYTDEENQKTYVIRLTNTDTRKGNYIYRVMTDTETVVYILDSNNGTYKEGSLSDITRNSYAFVPVIDKDGIAGAVLIDEYNSHKDKENGSSSSTPSNTNGTVTVKVYDNDSRFANGLANNSNLGITARYSKTSDGKVTVTVTGAGSVDAAIVAVVNGAKVSITNGSNTLSGTYADVETIEVAVILNK